MKAICIHEYGDESVLKYEDVPDPTMGPEDVIIRVRAASVNRGDLSRRSGGISPAPLSKPLIVGWDVAGDVEEIGSEVDSVQVGQRVVARLPDGGYAERASAPANVVVPLPDNVNYDEAASLPVAFLTAWVALLDTAKLKSGEACPRAIGGQRGRHGRCADCEARGRRASVHNGWHGRESC